VVTPSGGVAQASPKANPSKAQATKATANISFNVFLFIVISPLGMCAARKLAK
jgi:hypothetical protein